MFDNQFQNKSDFPRLVYHSTHFSNNNPYLYLQAFKIQSSIQNLKKQLYSQQYSILSDILSLIHRNSTSLTQLDQKINNLDGQLTILNQQLQIINPDNFNDLKQYQKLQVIQQEKEFMQQKKRVHYKIIFKEKIFGIRQYKYKLIIQGNLPLIFYKQRNLSFNVRLTTKNGEYAYNDHQFSLNLKVYYSNGEEVQQTKKGKNFIKGNITTLMMYGKASFDKICPREVTSKLQKRKIILVIYASKMRKIFEGNKFQIDPNQIEPFILYGIKVITKQKNKHQEKNKKNKPYQESQSQFIN